MKMNYRYIPVQLLLAAVLFCNSLFAGGVHNKPAKARSVVICGTFKTGDSASITIKRYFFYNKGMQPLFVDTTSSRGKFICRFQPGREPAYIEIQYHRSRKIITKFSGFLLVTGGDSVNITVLPDTVIFTGKSADKFICIDKIQAVKPKGGKYLMLVENAYEHMKETIAILDSLAAVKIQLLNRYRGAFSAREYELIKIDLIAEKEKGWLSDWDFCMQLLRDDRRQKQLIRFYLDSFLNRKTDTTHSELLAVSRLYPEYLLFKQKMDTKMMFNDFRPLPKSAQVGILFENIARNFQGLLRERLIMECFTDVRYFTDTSFTSLTRAVALVKHPGLRKTLVDIQRKAPGVPAYRFSLKDSSNRSYTPADFTGKVTVMEFWYTGCFWCTVLAKKMKPVMERFRDKDSVQFVTISVDKDVRKWKESVQSGIYSSAQQLNLYTNGLAYNHPLIQYYSITAWPHVIIIDKKGRIAFFNPDRPVEDDRFIDKFAGLINSALRLP